MSEVIRKYHICATSAAAKFLDREGVHITLIELYRLARHPELMKGIEKFLTITILDSVVFVSITHETKEYSVDLGEVEILTGGKIRARFV